MFYGSDSRDNLEENLSTSVNSLVECMGPKHNFYLCGDYKFLMNMANSDGSYAITSAEGWNLFHKSHKDSRRDVDPVSKLRLDLQIPIDRSTADSDISSIPISNIAPCVLHGFTRVVEKLLTLEVDRILSTANINEQRGADRESTIDTTLALFEGNINKRGARQGNFKVEFDSKGKSMPISLNKDHALVIMCPPPVDCPSDKYPHPMEGILCKKNAVQIQIPNHSLSKLDLPATLSDFELVSIMWSDFFTMQDIIHAEPTPRPLTPDPTTVDDYAWSYTPDDISRYRLHAERFYQLFCVRHGWEKLTPYMIVYVDHIPEMMEKLPFPLSRFMAEGGEHANYDDQKYFLDHTTHNGGKHFTCTMYSTLFHRFKTVYHEIMKYQSSDIEKEQLAFNKFAVLMETPAQPMQLMARRSSGIFQGLSFILSGTVPKNSEKLKQNDVEKIIVHNGGRVVASAPDNISNKKYVVVGSQARVDGKLGKMIVRAFRRNYIFVHHGFVFDSVKQAKRLDLADYSLDLSHLRRSIKVSKLTSEQRFFSKEQSLLTRMKKARKMRQVPSRNRLASSLRKRISNPALFYVCRRRKDFDPSVSFEEANVLNVALFREWSALSKEQKDAERREWLSERNS